MHREYIFSCKNCNYKGICMKKLLYLFPILLLLLDSCSKTKRYSLPGELHAYFDDEEGSYWIFKDSATATLDSFIVNSYSDNYFHQPYIISFGKTEFEHVNIHLTAYGAVDTTYPSINIDASGKDEYSSSIEYGSNFFNDFTNGMPFAITSSDTNIHKAMLPEVEINSKSYSNVYQYRKKHDSTGVDEILINAESGL